MAVGLRHLTQYLRHLTHQDLPTKDRNGGWYFPHVRKLVARQFDFKAVKIILPCRGLAPVVYPIDEADCF
jgi:hypothetical protein